MPKPVPIDVKDIRGAIPFPALSAKALDLVRRAHAALASGRGVPGVPTGLSKLDSAIGGLQTGLHILAAAPGSGKTALALSIARYAAIEHRLPVVYASFDEVPERLALKVLASVSGLSLSEMANAEIEFEQVEASMATHQERLAPLSFVYADRQLTAAELVEQLRDQLDHHQSDIGLLVVDYLQPWAAAQAAHGADYRVAVGAMALALRGMANETGCPVLLVSAQNRSGQGTSNMMSLRESSDLEYGADTIMLLVNDDEAQYGQGRYARLLSIAKNRFGPAGLSIPIMLDGRTQIMTEIL